MRLAGFLAVTAAVAVARASDGDPQLIREAQELVASDSFQPVEVLVSGLVTWVDPEEGRSFYVEDASGGIQVTFDEGPWPETGDISEVRGTLTRGEFAPKVERAVFTISGKGALPYAKPASGGGLLNGAYSCERVRLDGWIRQAELVGPHTLQAVINSGGARIAARISHYRGPRPEDLIAAKVEVRGVATPVKARGGTRQLVDVQVLASDAESLRIMSREKRNPWNDPVMTLEKAFSYRPGRTRGDRIHLCGQVVHRDGETIYLNDGTAGLALRGPGAVQFKRGDWVEAVGFMDIESSLPVVSDAVILLAQPAGGGIIPARVSFGELLDGLKHSSYVTLRGELIDRMRTPGPMADSTLVIALKTPEGVFTAELGNPPESSAAMNYQIGCSLDVAGVCQVYTDAQGNPTGFKILVPDAADIRLVKAESFFTVRRLLVILSVTLGVLLIATAYAYFSTRRNMLLRAEIGERRAVSAERSRLARDLHDTLEQGLTGIHLQLHSISPALEEASAETQKRLESVRSLVLQCHTEMRQSIWALRSAALEQFDLGDALKRIADSLALDSGIKVELQQRREPVRIPPLIEDNLLRIGQEAVTNAVKHAKAGRIRIELFITSSYLSLTVSDDGCGGEAQTRPGHFGLVGMRERTARIGGKLKIYRNSGGGTSVRVEVRLRPDQETPLNHEQRTDTHSDRR
jgi:signal transduction histidine kinase